MSEEQIDFKIILTKETYPELDEVKALLALVSLDYDNNIQKLVIARSKGKIVACAGLDRNVIKCVAIHPNYMGYNITANLIKEISYVANMADQYHLFLYTKPQNVPLFAKCGFYLVIEVDGLVAVMENTPVGLKNYCRYLQTKTTPHTNCAGIVINANPCTNGHVYLAEQAAKQSDWLYVFVLSEDISYFSFKDRFSLVEQAFAHIPNVTIFPTDNYLVSKATFPTYFLKDPELVDKAYLGIDLLIFRNYIAPSLNIKKRFVGTEPNCSSTQLYNQAMKYWLQDASVSQHPQIEVIEVERKVFDEAAISASRVRALIKTGQFEQIKPLVPAPTWQLIENLSKQRNSL